MENEEVQVIAVRNDEQFCCTCDHWSGTRVAEADQRVYSLRNLEGICVAFSRVVFDIEFDRKLTFSDTSCPSWKCWAELEEITDCPP